MIWIQKLAGPLDREYEKRVNMPVSNLSSFMDVQNRPYTCNHIILQISPATPSQNNSNFSDQQMCKERDQPAASCRPSSMHNCQHACTHGIRTPQESPWRSAPASISETMREIAQLRYCFTVRIYVNRCQSMSKFSDTADECAKVRTSFPVCPACIHERF